MPRLIVKKAPLSQEDVETKTAGQPERQETIVEKSDLVIPTENDVLSGRGKNIYTHEGNMKFLCFIKKYQFKHMNCPKTMKPVYAKAIYTSVNELVPPGRFLKPISKGALRSIDETGWVEMSYDEALVKIRQAMRDNDLKSRKKSKHFQEATKFGKTSSHEPQKNIGRAIDEHMISREKDQNNIFSIWNDSDRMQLQDTVRPSEVSPLLIPTLPSPYRHQYRRSNLSSGFRNQLYHDLGGQIMVVLPNVDGPMAGHSMVAPSNRNGYVIYH